MTQFYANPPNGGGANPATNWWVFFALSILVYFLGMGFDLIELGMVGCCSGLITFIVAITLSFDKRKQTILVQNIPQVVVGHIPQQSYVPQNAQPQIRQQPKPPSRVISPPRHKPPQQQKPQAPNIANSVAQQAKNLELARDFEGAAKLYQKAGLFGEAGRIRKEYIEKDDSPMVQIGHVGDSIVRDSVVMNEVNPADHCQHCGVSIQPDWRFCPGCNSSITG